MLHEAVMARAIKELTGAELKCLLATAYADRPLRIDDYPVLCDINRDTVIHALRGCVQAGYIRLKVVSRRHYYTLILPSEGSENPSGSGGGNTDGKPVRNMVSYRDAHLRTCGRTEEPVLRTKPDLPGCSNNTYARPENQAERESNSPKPLYLAETRRVAAYSAERLDDHRSLGYHIRVWNDARRRDAKAKTTRHCDELFSLITELTDRARKTMRHQGRAWTSMTQELLAMWEGPPDDGERDEISQIVRDSLAEATFVIQEANP